MVTAKEYQEEIKEKLSRILSIDLIGVEQRMKIPAYSPRVDIAIPPFAFDQTYITEYDNLLEKNREFFRRLKERALNRDRLKFDKNPNPRCFLAIEVENSTDNNAKHILGSIANASILGKVGIVVTMNTNKCLNRIHKYLLYVNQAGKIENEFKNVILIHKNDFDQILNQFL